MTTIPTTGLSDRLAALVGEITSLRHAATEAFPSSMDSSTVQQLHGALVTVRGVLDRLESIAGVLAGFKRMAAMDKEDAKAGLEDAWTSAATTPIRGSSVSEPAPRERYAHYDMAAIKDKVALRRAERRLADVAFCAEYAATSARGVDGLRRDLHVLISGRSQAARLES